MGLNRKRVNDLNWYFFPQKLCESGLIKETNEQRVQAQYIPCFGMLQADINHVLVPIYLAGGGGEGWRKGRKGINKNINKDLRTALSETIPSFCSCFAEILHVKCVKSSFLSIERRVTISNIQEAKMKASKSHPSSASQIASSLTICHISAKGKRPEVLSTRARVKPFYLNQEKRKGCQGACFLWRRKDSSFENEERGSKFRKTTRKVLYRDKRSILHRGMEIRKKQDSLKYYKILYIRVTVHHNNVPYISKT